MITHEEQLRRIREMHLESEEVGQGSSAEIILIWCAVILFSTCTILGAWSVGKWVFSAPAAVTAPYNYCFICHYPAPVPLIKDYKDYKKKFPSPREKKGWQLAELVKI